MDLMYIPDTSFSKVGKDYSLGIGTSYDYEQDLLKYYDKFTDAMKRKKLSFVIYGGTIIYNKWDSKYTLTLDILCRWLMEIGQKDYFIDIEISLSEYLERFYTNTVITPQNPQNAIVGDTLDNSGNMSLKIYTENGLDEHKSPAEFIRYVQYYCSLGHRSVKDAFDQKVLLVQLDGNIIFNGLTDGSLTMADLYDFFMNGKWSGTSSYEDRNTVYNQTYNASNNLNRKKVDDPNGVTQDYATYYTIFRRNK